VGIFSFLGKKERQPDEPEVDKDAARRKREGGSSRTGSPKSPTRTGTTRTGTTRTGNTQVQRDAARATAKKIDAIESEMTSELLKPREKTSTASNPPTRPKAPAPSPGTPKASTGTPASPPAAKSANSVLPAMGISTDFLLGGDSGIGMVEVASSETPPVIEEAAILFANEQTEMVEQMLLGAIHDTSLGDAIHTVWLMLFDLYQITGKQEQFENLSIDYAAKFETSPPAWDVARLDPNAVTVQPSGTAPVLTFSGKLDESIVKQLERAQKVSEKNSVIRLEFSRVNEVLPEGCELLLATLKKLQKAGNELVLVGAPELATKIRSIVEVGRRDDNEAPWWLLLEILQLLNREKEFEETSIDYCVTYEVSPPAFVAPKNKVTTDIEQLAAPEMEKDRFTMPQVVDAHTNVIASITEFAALHNPAVIDCTRLNRVDFSAAGQLLSAMAPLATKGRTVQLQNVNHLVAALFQVMGLRDIAHIVPRKN
jgi:ABC-type transporter Mla MlaB component